MLTGPSDRLRELVEHALRATEPTVALRALTALREELVAFERLQVARALDAGESFTGIANAMDISRQAAHRRYRDLVGVSMAGPQTRPGAPRGRIIVTSEARTAVNLAREEAAALGAGVVGSEHLLLGIIRSHDTRVTGVLRAAGVTLAEARRCVQPTQIHETATVAAPEPAPGPRGISAYARAVFEQSLREAVARGDGYIGVDHLLLATLGDPHGGAALTLDACGIDPATIRAQVAAG